MDILYLVLNLKTQTRAVRRILVTAFRTDLAGTGMKYLVLILPVEIYREG